MRVLITSLLSDAWLTQYNTYGDNELSLKENNMCGEQQYGDC